MSAVANRTMQFLITQEAVDTGVLHPVVALYRGVKQISKEESASAYQSIVKGLMSRLEDIKKDVLPTPEVQGFRELYANLGHKKVTPAGERLLNTCIKKGTFPQYGNLVDAYNIVALEQVVCIGVHDASAIVESDKPTLIFQRALGNEKIIPSFTTKEEQVHKGDLTYGIQTAKGFEPYAWLGKKDVDSSRHQLRDDTTSFLLTAIGHMHTSEKVNRALCERTFELLKVTCPNATMEIIPATVIDELPSFSDLRIS